MSNSTKNGIHPEITAAVIGCIGVILAAIIGGIFLLAGNTQAPPSQLTTLPTQIDVDTVPLSTPLRTNVETTVFSLQQASTEDFESFGGANFTLVDSVLEYTARYDRFVYISTPMPESFSAAVKATILRENGQFIIGVGNGRDWRPNYHFLLAPDALSLKRDLDHDVIEGWDIYLKVNWNPDYLARPDKEYDILFERKNTLIRVFVNGSLMLADNMQDSAMDLNHLYLAAGVSTEGYPPGTIRVNELNVTTP